MKCTQEFCSPTIAQLRQHRTECGKYILMRSECESPTIQSSVDVNTMENANLVSQKRYTIYDTLKFVRKRKEMKNGRMRSLPQCQLCLKIVQTGIGPMRDHR